MNLFDFHIPDWIFIALNLVILTLILNKIFFKPVNRILENRQEKAAQTERDADESARVLAELNDLRSRTEAELEAKTQELLKQAREDAGKEYDRIVAEAEKKAVLILHTAKTYAKQEQDRMMLEMKKQIVSTAMDAAGVLMRQNMDSDSNKRILEDYLSDKDVPA